MFGYKPINLLLIKVSKDLDITLGIAIADVQPELIEGIRCGALTVKPNISAFRFAKLLAICLCNQWASETESLCIVAKSTVDKFRSCSHIAPLIVSTELQSDAIVLILIKEIIAL